MESNTPSRSKIDNDSNVVFFDGVCGLCNAFVDFLLKYDKKKKLNYAPLQGKTFKNLCADPAILESVEPFLNQNKLERPYYATVFYWENGRLWNNSNAALKAVASLDGVWALSSILLLVPVFVRDFAYRAVSNNRYKWFGKKSACRLPSAEEQRYFYP